MANKTDSQALLSDATTVAAGGWIPNVAGYKTYQASGTTSAGAGAATIQVQGSNDGINADAAFGTITLTLATTTSSDGFTSADGYLYVRGNVTAISGTGASVTLIQSA